MAILASQLLFSSGLIIENAANEYFLGFSANYDAVSVTLQLLISTSESNPVNFKVKARGFTFIGVATNDSTIAVTLPSTFQVQSNNITEQGIHVKAEGDSKLTVYGFSNGAGTSDEFLALPCSNLAVDEYEYYGISYPRLASTSDILIVGCEDNTIITTPSTIFVLNRLETYLISSSDSTGVRITSTRPISFFSNHKCTDILTNRGACDLTEQIPPTSTWNTSFFVASLEGRMSGEIIRIIAAQNSTTISVNCTTFPQVEVYSLLVAGNWTEFKINPNSFCNIESSAPILVAQFALGHREDDITGDPFMRIIQSVEQYSNNYIFNIPSRFTRNYITIYLSPSYFGKILLDSASLYHSRWNRIYCSSGRICGYIVRVAISAGNHTLLNVDSDARIGVSVDGFAKDVSYVYPGGLVPFNWECNIVVEDCLLCFVSDDECATNICDSNAKCTNTPGSYICTCNHGYRGKGVTCDDIDECVTTNNCDSNAAYANTPGIYTCICNHGYNGSGITCNDIDECATTNNCDSNATCTNTPGSYTCTCNHGYNGSGITCEDIDECASTNTNNCDSNATCANTPGSYTCICNRGYSGNGVSCVLIIVRSHEVICYGSSSCGGSFEVITRNDCCTHGIGSVGLSFLNSGRGDCQPCPVVFGFNQTEFIGSERLQSYAVAIGFLSGSASQEVKGSIELTPVTASIGDVRLLGGNIHISPGSTDQQLVIFALLVDSVAQEEDETFIISLNLHAPLSVLGNNTIIISKMKGTIIDTNLAEFTIPGCSYWAKEKANAVMPVRVLKNQSTFLANPITFKLTPLTVAAAQSRGIIGNFPDDEISPNRAQEADFDGSILEIVFPADEDLPEPIIELPANIPIVNDEIDEANVQQFVVSLKLFSALHTSQVKIEQNTSICNIIDDDTLKIGFLQQSYNFQEPNHRRLFRNVTLIKEDNRTTEQTYSVAVTVNSSDMGLQAATLQSVNGISYDYSIGQPGRVFTLINFPPESQNITFPFFLNHDTLPEGTETFKASAVANSGFPTFKTPTNLFANTLISIIDDDDVIVGFEKLQYSVSEASGFMEICIIMTNPQPEESLKFEVITEYTSVRGTADGGDFTEIGHSQRINRFPISSSLSEPRKVCSNVSIINDDVYERDENFTLLLHPRLQSQSMFTLSIEPRITTITIIDEDDVVIGFINAPSTAHESDGNAVFEIGIISGCLQREVIIEFSIISGSAVDGSDFSYSGPQTYTFNASTNVSTINITFMKDNVYEINETFQARLSFHGQPLQRVMISPDTIHATIFDDDVLTFSFNQSSYEVNEDVGNATLNVSLSGNLGMFTAFVSVGIDDTSTIATARAGSDYMMLPSTILTFSNSTRFQIFTIAIIFDTIPEQVETIVVNITGIIISRNGIYMPFSPQEKSRIKVLSDYTRVIIYDNIQCAHQAPVVHTACLVVVWEAPSGTCGRINGYEIHFFNTITDRVYNGRSSTVFFLSSTVTPSLGPQHATYFQVRVTNGTWSEPVQLCP